MSLSPSHRSRAACAAAAVFLVAACLTQDVPVAPVHHWWDALGPVVPHDTFPSECDACHVGEQWNDLVDDFEFDHAAETGVALEGAHATARCLRCHNDRGPVQVFANRGCMGCHEDVHFGQLGSDCASCHQERTWEPVGQVQRHLHTRFPLVGVHAATQCHRCHPGAEVGKLLPTDTNSVSCHLDDAQGAQNPNHVLLGLLDGCSRCHMPTTWDQAEPE